MHFLLAFNTEVVRWQSRCWAISRESSPGKTIKYKKVRTCCFIFHCGPYPQERSNGYSPTNSFCSRDKSSIAHFNQTAELAHKKLFFAGYPAKVIVGEGHKAIFVSRQCAKYRVPNYRRRKKTLNQNWNSDVESEIKPRHQEIWTNKSILKGISCR